MRPTRVRALVALAAVATVLGWLLQRMLRNSGRDMPPVPWTAAIGLLLVACLVYSAAVPVRRLTNGSPNARPVDPLRAARTAVLGKATAYAGSVVLGWYLAQLLLLAPDLDISAHRSQALRAAVAALAALAVSAAGLLAERMCRVPPDDRTGDQGGRAVSGDPRGEGDPGEAVTGEVRRHE
jgi:Protein of unknown function (DUF3180)